MGRRVIVCRRAVAIVIGEIYARLAQVNGDGRRARLIVEGKRWAAKIELASFRRPLGGNSVGTFNRRNVAPLRRYDRV